MANMIIQLTKYSIICLGAVYTFFCFFVFRKNNSEGRRRELYKKQTLLIYLIQLLAYLALYMASGEINMWYYYIGSAGLLTALQIVYRVIYLNASVLLVNNMCMLLCTGLIMITRLDAGKAKKQMIIAAGSLFVTSFVPFVMSKGKNKFRKMKWLYVGTGMGLLLLVLILGITSYGAKISISIGGISVQPAEFVKLLYVFFVAAMYYEAKSFRQIVITSVIAAAHVLVLVASKDLGTALILFMIYVFMIFVATQKWYYLIGSAAFVCVAGIAGTKLFHHVQVRFLAWSNPLSVIDKEGYQISQSLFAIGTGGWFGTGLYQGMPTSIPVVIQDFVFSAISEEMGALYALCLMMVCFSSLLMFFNVAMQMKDEFYKLVALGLGCAYGFQVFLTIGGVIKFIPSTGVTLPLVSYGGSSLLATFVMFAIIQSLYILYIGKRD